MTLTSIEATVAHPPGKSADGIPIIEVQNQDGLTGWGEAQASRSPYAVCDIVRDLLGPALKNCSFNGERSEIEALWDRMYAVARAEGHTGGLAPEAIAAVDMALWDLAGKSQGRAVHEIAGAPFSPAIDTFGCLNGADAPRLRALRDAGLELFELTHQTGEDELLAALEMLKSGLPKSVRFAVNARWRLSPALDFRMAREIDRCRPVWLANPLPPEDPFAHGRLAKAIVTPLALGECYHSHYELAPFFHEMAVGVLQLDLGRCGLTEAYRMAEIARVHGIPIVVRVGATLGPHLAAALQFAASAPGRRVEYDPSRLKTANSVLSNAIALKRGQYQLPAAPGLGIAIEEAELHLMETQIA